MEKKDIRFLIAGLLISLILAVFISPFASSSPDGLEKVAEDKGFIHLAEEEGVTVWESSPVPDYAVPGIKNEYLKTALAGFIGTAIMLGLGFVLARALSKDKRRKHI